MRLLPQAKTRVLILPATGSPKRGFKGNRVKARAAPATVSGEPRIKCHWAPCEGLTGKAMRKGVDPQVRRPACRSRLSTVRGWAVRADISDGDVLDRPQARQ